MNFFRRKKKTAAQHKDVDLIKDLAAILREHGHRILAGEVLFSLNTTSLTCLNEGLTQISSEEKNITYDVVQTHNSKLAIFHDLQFLYDFIQKVMALKLVHGNATLQGRVNIYKFRMLKSLEIKKIPIHLVMGLQSLRPKLESITCNRSVQSLEGLFARCGGDMSQDFTWSELKAVDLSYNGIEAIDESLKLVPYLELLNLSHNNLKEANNLQHVTILKQLSLSFNCLSECPMLSTSSRSILISLNLSYNNLESLKGVDELYALEDLDVSGNCLVDHSVLQRVMLLRSLKSLNLKENPMSYHKRHREFTIGYLHPETSRTKFSLDGKHLSKHELTLVKKIRVYSISNHISNSEPRRIIDSDLSEEAVNIQCTPASRSLNQSLVEASDTSLEWSCSPATRRKSRKTSRMVDAVIIDPTTLDNHDLPTADEQIRNSEEHLEIKSRVKSAREKFGTDWLIAEKENLGVVPKPDEEAVAITEPDYNVVADVSDTKEDDAAIVETSLDVPEISRSRSPNMYDQNDCNDVEGQSSEDELVIDDATFYVVHMDENEDGPSYIVTLGSRYIKEKDSMTGKELDELDLLSLIRYQANVKENIFCLNMVFDYVKKTKRERSYYFEDESQLNDFSNRLEPFIVARNLKAIKTEALQCLKCSAQFLKSSALTIVKNVRSEEQQAADIYSINSDHPVEVSVCPNCRSEMIVEINHSPAENMPVRKASTPLSSSSSVPRVSFLDSNFNNNHNNAASADDDVVHKVLKDDAVIYASSVADKVEIKVEAEVYKAHSPANQNVMTAESDEPMKCDNAQISRNDSDISILSNPSQSSIAVLSNECEANDGSVYEPADKVNTANGINDSFSDSMSGSACTQMETSVYEDCVSAVQNLDIDENHTIVDSNGNSQLADSETQTLDNSSFMDLDYRIKLHLSMQLFGKDEDFRLSLNAGLMNYQKQQEMEGMVLLSNKTVYMMKVLGDVCYDEPQNYLQKIDSRSMSNLKYITVLYGKQGIQLEFVVKSKPVVYNVFIRDSQVCQHFMTAFGGVLSEWSAATNTDMPLISTSNKDTLTRINSNVFNNDQTNDNDSLTLYIMGFWSSNGDHIIPVSFIFTKECLYVTQENFKWPVPWSFTDMQSDKNNQFSVLSCQKIMNLTEIECDPAVDETKANLHFLDEGTMQQSTWTVTMATLYSMNCFVSAIRTPWEELFGVELNMPSPPKT